MKFIKFKDNEEILYPLYVNIDYVVDIEVLEDEDRENNKFYYDLVANISKNHPWYNLFVDGQGIIEEFENKEEAYDNLEILMNKINGMSWPLENKSAKLLKEGIQK